MYTYFITACMNTKKWLIELLKYSNRAVNTLIEQSV